MSPGAPPTLVAWSALTHRLGLWASGSGDCLPAWLSAVGVQRDATHAGFPVVPVDVPLRVLQREGILWKVAGRNCDLGFQNPITCSSRHNKVARRQEMSRQWVAASGVHISVPPRAP